MNSLVKFIPCDVCLQKLERIRAILVDDEESARDVLANLLQRFCPVVDLMDKCEDLPKAAESIKKHKPDLVFLDIEMPNYAGYEITKFFEVIDFDIVFVTAYDQYAVRAFEMAAIDYLLKPIDIPRLQTAISRVKLSNASNIQNQRMELLTEVMDNKKIENILVSDRGNQHLVKLDNIIAIEAQESYCTIYTIEAQYVVSKNLKHFESLLSPLAHFFRVHKSWIVNLNYLEHYSKSDLNIQLKNKLIAKLSKYKKAEFEAKLIR